MIVRRKDSPFWWLNLERPGQRPIRESTKIPVEGATVAQARELRQLAEATYNIRMAELARARYKLPDARRKTRTFGELLDWYLAHVTVHKRSAAGEERLARTLRAAFGPRLLGELTREAIREWMTRRRESVSAGTVNRELTLLHHVLQQAVPREIDANPASRIGRLRETRQAMRILSREEETRLLAALDARGRALVLTALDTLMRLSNVRTLRRRDDHGAWIAVVDSKVDAYQVPVSTRLRTALDALPDHGEFYFAGRLGGRPPARWHVVALFEAGCRKAGIPLGRAKGGVSFHALRHTGASRMVEAGVDLRTVQEIGGWKNLTQLARYAHPSDARQREAVDLIGPSTPGTREPDA